MMDFNWVNEKCCGCGACAESCPKQIIELVENEEGFMQACLTDNKQCINCGKCKKICPMNSEYRVAKPLETYMGWAIDENTRKNGTSGGVISALSYYFVANEHYVVSSELDLEDASVQSKLVSTYDGVRKCSGTKYCQADQSEVIPEIMPLLGSGKKMLVIGTPCQIYGLTANLTEQQKRYITSVDFICHGVPSRKLFRDYYKSLGGYF